MLFSINDKTEQEFFVACFNVLNAKPQSTVYNLNKIQAVNLSRELKSQGKQKKVGEITKFVSSVVKGGKNGQVQKVRKH